MDSNSAENRLQSYATNTNKTHQNERHLEHLATLRIILAIASDNPRCCARHAPIIITIAIQNMTTPQLLQEEFH